jgi:hypothetical protein
MKVSLKQALSIGLMATLTLPGFIPAIAENASPAAPAENKDDKKPQNTAAANEATKTPASSISQKEAGPFALVDDRIQRIEHRLVEDLSTGRLDPSEANDLKKMLDQVSEIETSYRADTPTATHWLNIHLNHLLDKVNDAIDHTEHDRDLASADLDFTRIDLFKRIDLAAREGRLTPKEVADLKQHFEKINSYAAALHQKQGKLSYVDKLMLCIEYDHLALKLSQKMGDMSLAMPDFSTMSNDILKKAEDAAKAGNLSDSQLQEIKKRLDEIAGKVADAKKSVPASVETIITLGVALEEVSNRIDTLAAKIDATADIDKRLAKIDCRIAKCLDEGSLNPLETLELKEDLDAIRSARGSGAVKDEDVIALKHDLARLEGRLDRQIHEPSRTWSGLNVGIVHYSSRDTEALKAKRLSADEMKSFLREIAALNKKRADFIKTEGGMTTGQALSIATGLQEIAGRLEKRMKDRDMAVPDIDALRKAIDNRIGESTVTGELTRGDARTAELALNQVNSVKEKYHASNNELDAREKFAVAFELERVSSNFEEQMHGHEALFPGLDRRRGQIEALINEGLSSGRISETTADFYKQKLAENSKLEKQYRADALGLTGDKALELVNSLEQLWDQLDREIREQRISSNDLISLQGFVERKIRTGFSYGLLSADEAARLRKTYDNVTDAFNKMRAEDGGLSYGERLAFAYGFQRLLANVERTTHSSPVILPSLDNQRRALEQRLGNLLATGRLPVKEAEGLKKILDELGREAAEKRDSGGGMSYQEILLVSVNLERLKHRVEEKAATATSQIPNIDTLRDNLRKSVEDAHAKGKLSDSDYKTYKEDLDRIEANEASFRMSDEALDYAEALNLILDIERVKNKLESSSKVSSAPQSKRPKR